MAFAIIFYQGGSMSGSWIRAADVATVEEAEATIAAIERAGRPALWFREGRLEAIGMPTGAPCWWDFAALAAKPDVPSPSP